MKNKGYSLLEVSISMALLSIVSLMGFMALKSSTESAALSQAQGEIQANLRDVMTELVGTVREAYTQRTVDVVPPLAPEGAASVLVNAAGNSLTFQVPEPSASPGLVVASAPITVRFENEDVAEGAVGPNARLDSGEDKNGNGMLDRRLLWTQAGETRVVGGANNLSQARFELRPNAVNNNLRTTLYVFLEATKRYGGGEGILIRGQLESTIHLEN